MSKLDFSRDPKIARLYLGGFVPHLACTPLAGTHLPKSPHNSRSSSNTTPSFYDTKSLYEMIQLQKNAPKKTKRNNNNIIKSGWFLQLGGLPILWRFLSKISTMSMYSSYHKLKTKPPQLLSVV